MYDVIEDAGLAGATGDQRLVQLAGRGDHDAFTSLVESRLEGAVRQARAILGNEADAYDVVQEAFIAAWRHLPRLRDAERFDAWLSRIVLNRCRDAKRRRRRAREVAIDRVVVEGVLDSDMDLSTLNAAFEQLDLGQRQLLVMHHLQRESVADIARRLGRPVGTVKWRLHGARRALERALEAQQ